MAGMGWRVRDGRGGMGMMWVRDGDVMGCDGMGWRWDGDGVEMGWRWDGDGMEMGWR